LFVAVTGLPASGKSTLGRALSSELFLPFIDKDDILEALFGAFEVRSPDDRSRLSRASDAVLESVTLATQGAVLASFWRRAGRSEESGTPTQWLSALTTDVLIEVHCECDPALAASRFVNRKRHSSHWDGRTSEPDLRTSFAEMALEGPVLGGITITVPTSEPVDIPDVAALVRDEATRRGWRGLR
jgi:predicted kinase